MYFIQPNYYNNILQPSSFQCIKELIQERRKQEKKKIMRINITINKKRRKINKI